MSLQVWLPLNGNLNNQGLSEVTVTNSGATVSTSGKIGSCYLLNSAKLSLTPSFITSFYGDFSFSLWLKVNSFHMSYETYLQVGIGTSPWTSYRIGLLRNAETSNLTFCISDGSSSTQNNCYTSYSVGTWYHFTCTYSKTEQKMRIYKNGVLSSTYSTSIIPKFSDVSYITLGQINEGSYKTNCLMNDFRLYDHCLSAKEVKEISKGLVCHYKLDNKGLGSPNLLAKSSIVNRGCTSLSYDSTSNTWTGVAPTGSSSWGYGVTFSNSSNKISVPIGTTACFSLEVNPDVNCSCNADVNNATTDGSNPSGNDNDDTPKRATKGFHLTANKWNKVYWTYTAKNYNLYDANSNWGIVTTDLSSPVNFKLRNIKVEHGTKPTTWCPHTSDSFYTSLGLDSTTESDCSGLSNNGTKIGGLSSSTNPLSIRYESCYDFDGNTGSIQISNLATLVPSGEFTMNCWIYHDNTWSSKGYETILGGPSGFELEAKPASTNSPSLYAYSWGQGQATYELNKWNMITMTRNASEAKFYINGELKITGSAGTIPSGNYFIGAWNSSSQQNYKGRISDFRLYSTVLSVEDIKELYNTSASIDKNGNIHTYEFKEE